MRASRSEPPRLEGTPNFRDLGGLPTVDGRVTRHGVLFRSSALEELMTRDVRLLIDDIGLRTVIDLRSDDDRVESADTLLDVPVRYLNLPISRGGPTTSLERPMGADGRADMALIYGCTSRRPPRRSARSLPNSRPVRLRQCSIVRRARIEPVWSPRSVERCRGDA